MQASPTEKSSPRRFADMASDKQAVLAELARMAFANMLDYVRVDPAGHADVDLSRLDRDKAAAVDEVIVDYADARDGEQRNVKRVRFKLTDKRAALVDLGRHLGLFSERRQPELDFRNMSEAEIREQFAAAFASLATTGVDPADLLPDRHGKGS
jgi:phage terminase small subunit